MSQVQHQHQPAPASTPSSAAPLSQAAPASTSRSSPAWTRGSVFSNHQLHYQCPCKYIHACPDCFWLPNHIIISSFQKSLLPCGSPIAPNTNHVLSENVVIPVGSSLRYDAPLLVPTCSFSICNRLNPILVLFSVAELAMMAMTKKKFPKKT